jgi:hypothetical protein
LAAAGALTASNAKLVMNPRNDQAERSMFLTTEGERPLTQAICAHIAPILRFSTVP